MAEQEEQRYAPALVRGDDIGCASCDQLFAFGVAAVAPSARLKCPRCKRWIAVPVRRASEGRCQCGRPVLR